MAAQKVTRPRALRLSHDGRTNVWEVICPACHYRFTPITTLYATQTLTCPAPRCGQEMVAYYNEDRVVLIE